MGKKALKEWRRKLHELHRRRKELASLIKASQFLPDTQFYKQRTKKLEAQRASVVAEIEKHKRFGENAGFTLGDSSGNKGTKPKPQTDTVSKGAVSPGDLSNRSTESLEARVRALNKQIRIYAPGFETPHIKALREEKESLTRELKRRKAPTGHQTRWKQWSKGPGRARFWRGR